MRHSIANPSQLRAFRQSWGEAPTLLALLKQYAGNMIVKWAIGVGKSHTIDRIIEFVATHFLYDLVILLAPTKKIIRERAYVKNPPDDIKVVVLKPRPVKQCGKLLNQQWKQYESKGLGLLGRNEICKSCPKYQSCFWPDQYGKKLEGTRVIFATQAHLERSPVFLQQLKKWTKATTVLTIIDEDNFLMKSFSRVIHRLDIERFIQVIANLSIEASNLKNWEKNCTHLLSSTTSDLRTLQLKMPSMSPKVAAKIQKTGSLMFGVKFKYIGYDLSIFPFSTIRSRERLDSGDISFAVHPFIKTDLMVFSGTGYDEFIRYRLRLPDIASPFENYTFTHPETKWFNIASRLGARVYFKNNSTQILDFFAQLIIKRINQGKRVLLIAKKIFIPLCIKELNDRLPHFGLDRHRVETVDKKTKLSDVTLIPIINYGVIGINKFEDFDCAFCLTGYYINTEIIDTILQDIYATDFKIPVKISAEGLPLRRTAHVEHYKDRFYNINYLAPMALNQLEMDVVLQAVGRIRPYTKPREVITFQCNAHPQIEYTKEFICIDEARNYFNISTRREFEGSRRLKEIQNLKESGLTQKQIAERMGISERTVQRYWK